ncbi:MAG: pyridoxal phosphate-dependent aminotransferase [Peptococcaceae bacterium]|jgi:aspartate aminotransferase|nr:pyridoxal phosphate-dependent aminotransferase [Peptococcaceae bacterium]MDH7526053.1 pyridoxal phosphate-dependent aminotransferase [Peptococcaceae bacterium]
MRTISPTVSAINPSATCSTAEKAAEMKRKGINIIEFAEGEPDFDTPENIKKAAVQALKIGFTKYTAVAGIKELKEAIAFKLSRDNGLEYSPSQILVSNGAKQALCMIFMTVLQPGDQVLIPTPAYVSFIEQIKIAGALPIFVKTEAKDNFRLTLEQVKSNYNSKVKAIVLNSPNNPTGAVYSEEDLKQIVEFLVEKNVWIITDEVYEKLIYDGIKYVSPATLCKGAKDWTITINSVSKTYAMTGWRVGYAAGPHEIIDAASKLQGHVTGNVNSIAQKAAVEALLGPQDEVVKMVAEYDKRRKYIVERLNSIKRIRCNTPQGAFYVFPDISGLYGARYDDKIINDEMDVVNFLLDEAHIAVVQGAAFEYPGYIRIVFAKSMEEIAEGMDRLEQAIDKLNF